MHDPLAAFDRDVLLATGRSVRIRPSRASDTDAVRAFYDRLSDESIYLRFFHARPKLLADRLHPPAGNDIAQRVVLLALDDDRVVGSGEYWRLPGSEDAEVAFAVADSHQHEGIATVMLEDLALFGRAAGLRHLVADTLFENAAMLDVFRMVGLPHRISHDSGHVHVELDLQESAELEAEADGRDWRSAVTSLSALFDPKHVVVIGAGSNTGSPGRVVLNNLCMSFQGRISVVHPSMPSVQGIPTVPCVGDLDDVPDLAIVVVPAGAVAQVVEDCGKKGVAVAVVISAGFAESGSEGAALQSDLLEIARRHGMRVLGPNCLGVVSTAAHLDATFMHGGFEPGPIAIASQSGGIGITLAAEAARRHLGVSSFVSVGNKIDISGNDLLRYWADDPATEVVVMYLESIGDPRRFARIARSVSKRLPIVALKSGRTEAGERAARSHTAALATDDLAVDALFAHTGVVRVDTLDQLLDVASLLAAQPAPAGRRIALVGNAGGPLILAADAAARNGLHVVQLSAQLQQQIRNIAPDAAATTNPVDLLATAAPHTALRVLQLVARSGEVDACALVLVDLADGRESRTLDLQWSEPAVPAAAVVLGGVGESGSMPSYPTAERAIDALARAAERGEWLAAESGEPLIVATGLDPFDIRRRTRGVVTTAHPGWLSVEATYELLEVLGVPVLPWGVATTVGECVREARRVGFPCVVKADVADVVHKSDVGAVVVGVASAHAVRQVVADFRRRFGDRLRGVLVQRQAEPGIELLIGGVRDPTVGPLVVVAAGGVHAELLADRSVTVAPVNARSARAALESLRAFPLLGGYRGGPKAPVEPIVDVIERIGALIAAVPEITQLDLNPVVASASGCVVVDARIAVGTHFPQPLRALRGRAA